MEPVTTAAEKQRARCRAWHAANRDRANAAARIRGRKRYAENRDRLLAQTKKRYVKDRDVILARDRAAYAVDPERRARAAESARRWALENPEKVRRIKAKQKARARLAKPWKSCLYSAKYRAKKLGIAYELTDAWAEALWTGRCSITGAQFELASKPVAFSPSIDRKDSTKGYTQENCRFILWAVNRFKSDYSDEVMLQIARQIVEGFDRAPSS